MTHEDRNSRLLRLGLLDPDQPTEWSTQVHREVLCREFTRAERAMIRVQLGLVEVAR